MSEFVVHSVPGSPYGRAVLATVEEKGAPYRLAPVAPGTLKVEPHISRHPFGRVPTLAHGDFALYETQAILRYLDRVLPSPPLTPADPRAAARMDQVLNVHDWYLFQGVCNVIAFQRVIKPRLMGQPADEAAVEAAMPQGRTVFAELARLLGGQPWFAGETFSLADILVASQLDLLTLAPEWTTLSAAHPKLVAWLERTLSRPSFQATTWAQVSAMAEAA